MTNFERGLKAAKIGNGIGLCRLEGEARKEWMCGFDSYKPEAIIQSEDVRKICDEFALKHFKNNEDGNETN